MEEGDGVQGRGWGGGRRNSVLELALELELEQGHCCRQGRARAAQWAGRQGAVDRGSHCGPPC